MPVLKHKIINQTEYQRTNTGNVIHTTGVLFGVCVWGGGLFCGYFVWGWRWRVCGWVCMHVFIEQGDCCYNTMKTLYYTS